jgi:hypothetical protein
MASRRNPYGDGSAGKRTVAKLLEFSGLGVPSARSSDVVST